MKKDSDTLKFLALIAFKHGEISEGRTVELTGMSRDKIRDEMHKRCGKFKPLDEALAELQAVKEKLAKAHTISGCACGTCIAARELRDDKDPELRP